MSLPKEIESGIEELAAISRIFGSNDEYVLAGGGNTSWKNEKYLFVKRSGVGLRGITADGFVGMDRDKLAAIWQKEYPRTSAEREAEALADLMAAKLPGNEDKRPSVETLLHDLFPYAFVIHTHPALVNGVTCAIEGRNFVEEELESVWVPVVDPGYLLALEARKKLFQYQDSGSEFPKIVFLQNHGIFVAADTTQEIEQIYKEIFKAIDSRLHRDPAEDLTLLDGRVRDEVLSAAKEAFAVNDAVGFTNADLVEYCTDEKSFLPLSLSFTPDHIVYAGHKPLYVKNLSELSSGMMKFIRNEGVPPKIIAIKDAGVFALGNSLEDAERAMALFLDGVKVAVYAGSFGGANFMPERAINFIRNWEVENYRASIKT